MAERKKRRPESQQYQVRIQLSRQEDGLWRAEVPGLPGCFVDAPTLAEAIADVQEVIAMALDELIEEDSDTPQRVVALPAEPAEVVVPILLSEYRFRRPKRRSR